LSAAALDGVRVLEIGDESAEYCGRLLAGLGADVVKAEPPEGSPSRSFGPFAGDEPGPDRSLAFWADNVGKRSVVVGSDDEVLQLCEAADVLVHTLRASESEARGLDFATLSATFPELVVCVVTPFGQSGPWAEYLADDLVLMALGGSMAACGYRPTADGSYDTPPLCSMGDQAWRTASTYAAIAVLTAVYSKWSSGAGQLIDVSAHECSASMTEWHLLSYICSGFPYRRAPHPTLKAKDGRRIAALVPDFLGPHVFDRLLEMLEDNGVAGPLSDPAFRDPSYRAANYNELWQALKRLAASMDGEAVYRMGQSAGLPWGVIRSPDEVVDDPHLQSRGHFVTLEHPELAGQPGLSTEVTYPGAPFVAHASPWAMSRRPPLLGEHTDEVHAEWGAAATGTDRAGRTGGDD
jgi:crotonobetainyl-CoA:carnitine CoA-transferase CaiB-like acyl-CoA transferase